MNVRMFLFGIVVGYVVGVLAGTVARLQRDSERARVEGDRR